MELFNNIFFNNLFLFATLGYGNLFLKIVKEKHYKSLGEIGYFNPIISLLVLFFLFYTIKFII